jgi:CubicO group peptidase (beta-lactamase class C family)
MKALLQWGTALGACVVLTTSAHALPIVDGTTLAGLYRGSDGGVLYLRAVGQKVVGFAEHPFQGYAFVLSGTRNGSQITARWWDIPKAARASSGSITLAIAPASPGVPGLKRVGGGDFGPDTYSAIGTQGIVWPGPRPAGFQSIQANDLDGAFDGPDKSRHYVRESADGVVWVGEAQSKSGVRPAWVTVFIGARQEDGAVRGDYYDVPKGTSSKAGPFGATSVAGERRTYLSQANVDRGGWLEPDYAVDFAAFGEAVEEAMASTAVGFGYAIAYKGKVVRTGAGGLRRIGSPGKPWDSSLPFTAITENAIDSASKAVTAMAVVRALETHGWGLDTLIGEFVPECWDVPLSVRILSFRDLLDHSAGLYYAGSQVCADNPYRCLREALEKGRTRPPGYHNIHYGVLRLLLAFVIEHEAMTEAFATLDCKSHGVALNDLYSEAFRADVLDLLADAGVVGDFAYLSDVRALMYNFQDLTIPGALQDPEIWRKAGAGGLVMSAVEFVKLLAKFDAGKVVGPMMVTQMKDGRLGFDDFTSKSFRGDAGLGPYYVKNGGHTDDQGRGAGTWLMILPSKIQVVLTYNSSSNPADATPRALMLKAAFETAIQ